MSRPLRPPMESWPIRRTSTGSRPSAPRDIRALPPGVLRKLSSAYATAITHEHGGNALSGGGGACPRSTGDLHRQDSDVAPYCTGRGAPRALDEPRDSTGAMALLYPPLMYEGLAALPQARGTSRPR